jgi:hypothetical protein
MLERCEGKSLIIIQNKIDIQSTTKPPLEPCSLATIGTQEITALGIPQGDACYRRDARNHRNVIRRRIMAYAEKGTRIVFL